MTVRSYGKNVTIDAPAEPCTMGEALGGFVQRLAPVHTSSQSVGEAWNTILPQNLRAHCRIEAISGGSLKVVADAASYMYELQLCKDELLLELQRLCPGAGLRRMQVGMARGGR